MKNELIFINRNEELSYLNKKYIISSLGYSYNQKNQTLYC